MLKHIKDIRSPIAVAQQKHAARKASSIRSESPSNAQLKPPSGSGHGRSITRPPKLEVHDISAATPIMSGVSAQPGWPEVMSPSLDNKDRDELATGAHSSTATGTTLVGSASNGLAESMKSRSTLVGSANTDGGEITSSASTRETPVPSSGVSYAVAIYPYMAEQEDEFDVVV